MNAKSEKLWALRAACYSTSWRVNQPAFEIVRGTRINQRIILALDDIDRHAQFGPAGFEFAQLRLQRHQLAIRIDQHLWQQPLHDAPGRQSLIPARRFVFGGHGRGEQQQAAHPIRIVHCPPRGDRAAQRMADDDRWRAFAQ